MEVVGDREGGESCAEVFAGLKAETPGRRDGCGVAGCQRRLELRAAECAVLNMLMLDGCRLRCHSWLARRTLPLRTPWNVVQARCGLQ